MRIIILKIFPIVGMDNEIHYNYEHQHISSTFILLIMNRTYIDP